MRMRRPASGRTRELPRASVELQGSARSWMQLGMPSALRLRQRRYTRLGRRTHMLHWAAVFFVIAILAAILGFGGLAASAAGVAKVLFFLFLVLALLSLVFGRRVST